MEVVFGPEIFRIFSNAFRLAPAGKHRKLAGIRRKKSGQFPAGILLPCSADSRYFPAGSGDRNHRPGWITIFYVRIKIHLKKKENSLLFLVQHPKHHILISKILLINFKKYFYSI